MAQFSRVLITGASSGNRRGAGAGARRARRDAASVGPRCGRLAAVANACRARGATAHDAVLDVRDAVAMAAWVAACGRARPGGGERGHLGRRGGKGTGERGTDPRHLRDQPGRRPEHRAAGDRGDASGSRRARTEWRGRIAVVASIAAFVAGSAAPAYCASKAAADAWTVATAVGLRRDGIALTSVCPGYIRTAMTARNRFPMPGLMDADRAARIILRAVAAGASG